MAQGTGDIVGQALIFPQVQKQAAAHPVAQDAVQQQQRIAVGVGQGYAGQAQAHMGLVAAFPLDPGPGAIAVAVHDRLPIQRCHRLPIRRGLPNQIDHFVMFHIAGYGDNRVGRVILPFHIIPHGGQSDVVHRFRRAAHIPPHGLLRPQDFVDQQPGPVRGIVIGHPQFLLDDLPLLFHFRRIQ